MELSLAWFVGADTPLAMLCYASIKERLKNVARHKDELDKPE